ncbi:MAG TPA: hypothetical protein VK661_01020 [Planctomycetota bacterium]|nr:hypothetical protein [Planctomycetota bacterium]
MNSKTAMMIVAIGGLGLLGLIMATLMWLEKITPERRALIRTSVEVADKFKVEEVTITIIPPLSISRTLKIGYETSIVRPSLDSQREEMESVMKFVWEKVERREKDTIRKVEVRRTWRSKHGCSRKPDIATIEWTPPTPPPRR